MHPIHALSCAAALLLATATASPASVYKVVANLSPDDDGTLVRLVNYDTGLPIDSTEVANGQATFIGDLPTALPVRVLGDGVRSGSFLAEPSHTVTVDVASRTASGSPLNDRYNAIGQAVQQLGAQFNAAATDSARAAVQQQYRAVMAKALAENIDNALGYFLFMEQAYEMDSQALQKAIADHPGLGQWQRVQKLLTASANKAATQPGAMYVDFEVPYEGKMQRLSDYVGRGRWTLVDFWASWCGPCIRETAVLKDLLKEYGPQGLDVVGVAVWDKPEDTKGAIAKHQLPWPQIMDAQTIPTDLYGISAIPSILLIDPQGRIVSRDQQDEALREDVRRALAGQADK